MYGATAVDRGIADSRGQRLSEGRWFGPPASTQVFPLARKGIAAFPVNPVNPVILSKKKNRGFTLVELMVAMAIFVVLMAGVTMIFVGSLRTTQVGYQQMKAYEQARTALSVIDDDLVRSFSSQQSADVHNFYGTPIGMTFIGTVQATSDPKDLNIARITYVVYNQTSSAEWFPEAFEDPPDSGVFVPGYPYPLLRYVEPGASDLESFRVKWGDNYDGVVLGDVLQGLCAQSSQNLGLQPFTWTDPNLDPGQQDIVRAKKCEIWIRMLAGGDRQVPVNFWRRILDVDYSDYVVTENVISIAPEAIRQTDTFGESGGLFTPFFNYAVYGYDPVSGEASFSGSPWWNDSRAWNRREPRLPEVVEVKFWMMFPSPYPGAPDFRRRFTLQVNVPTGYARRPE